MRKVITFLGKYPKETVYEFGGKPYNGRVFAEAMRQFLAFDEMLVFVTDEARTDALPVLTALNDARIRDVTIPRGESNAEMWQIFEIITSQVNEGETVIFDITHGLRSLPFLVFIFAAYLRSAKRVNIEAIYYGAFELGDSKTNKPAPVIDLSEFVGMLDWLTATDQFVQTGDARRLAQMLEADASKKASVNAAQKLSQVSLAAFLCQPFTLMQEAQTLGAALEKAQPELAAQTLPFDVMREQITETFGAFGADWERDRTDGLRKQFRLIEWYYQNNQLIQAMTLAREWLISAVTLRLGQPIDLEQEPRKEMEWAVSGLARVDKFKLTDPLTGERRKTRVTDLNEYAQLIYTTWTERDELIELWSLLSAPRNALDHAEHQFEKMSLAKITANADKIMPRLRALAVKWGFAERDSAD
jgi:CRISPR-associated DxTHG motif protein